MSSPQVLIIGGGVIGLSTAYFLAKDGVRVGVVDQVDFGQEASWAGAGILPPGSSTRARHPYDQLLAVSSEMFPKLSAELRERTGIDNGYLRCGGLELGGDAAQAEAFRRAGIACELLDDAAVKEPALALRLGPAIFLPDLAQVRNPWHVRALVAGCRALGVAMQPNCPVQELARSGSRISGVQTGAGLKTADRYLIAAGAWSEKLLAPLGWRPGIRPVRGQIALLNSGARLFRAVVHVGKNYLVPRADGRVLAGSTEEDVGFDKRTTESAIAELVRMAISLVPALSQAPLERSWAGLRPGSPDGMPFLGPVPGLDNLFIAAGHFRAGLQLSPGTGLVMKELILGRSPAVEIEAFRLDRKLQIAK